MSIHRVTEFHAKFNLPTGDENIMDEEAFRFRHGFLREELEEMMTAHLDGDSVGMFDALLDLAYVAYGTALFMGISAEQWEEGMDAVHRANMTKERAKSATDSRRGSTLDVVKPAGWTGPESTLKEILGV